MKKHHELLNPSSVIKIALGKQVLKFANLQLKKPLAMSSYLELGRMFCDVFNDNTSAMPMNEQALSDLDDSMQEMHIDANGIAILVKALLAETDPSVSGLGTDELIINPHYLDQVSRIMLKIQKHGLKSVMTPNAKKKLIDAGYNFLSTKVSNFWPIIGEETSSPVLDGVLFYDYSGLEQYINESLSCFRVPRGRNALTIDAVVNIILAGSVLAKAVNDAQSLDQLISIEKKNDIVATNESVRKFLGSKGAKITEVESPFIQDVKFFIEYERSDRHEKTPFSTQHMSYCCYSLNKFKTSNHTQDDLLNLLKNTMPFLGRMKDLLNQMQVEDQKLLSARNKDLTEAKLLCQNQNFKAATEKYNEVYSFFQPAKIEDIPRQMMQGKILIKTAYCFEKRNELQRALELYLRAQSIFSRLILIEGSRKLYQKCDSNIFNLLQRLDNATHLLLAN